MTFANVTRRARLLVVTLCVGCIRWVPVATPADAVGAASVRVVASDGKITVVDHPTARDVREAFKSGLVEIRKRVPVDGWLITVATLMGFVAVGMGTVAFCGSPQVTK